MTYPYKFGPWTVYASITVSASAEGEEPTNDEWAEADKALEAHPDFVPNEGRRHWRAVEWDRSGFTYHYVEYARG